MGEQEATELFKVLRETLDSQLDPMLATLAASGSGSSAICNAARDATFSCWRQNCKQLLNKADSHEQLTGGQAQSSSAQSRPSENDVLVQVWLC